MVTFQPRVLPFSFVKSILLTFVFMVIVDVVMYLKLERINMGGIVEKRGIKTIKCMLCERSMGMNQTGWRVVSPFLLQSVSAVL